MTIHVLVRVVQYWMVYGIDWKQKTNTTITKNTKREKRKKICYIECTRIGESWHLFYFFLIYFFLLVSLILKRRPVAFFVDNFISAYHPPSISLSYRSLFVCHLLFSLLSPFSSSLSPPPSSSSPPIFGRTRSIKCPTKREWENKIRRTNWSFRHTHTDRVYIESTMRRRPRTTYTNT